MDAADYVPGLPEHRPVMTRALVFDTDEILTEAQDWMSHAVFVVAPEHAFPTTTVEVTHAMSQQLRIPPHNIKVSRHQPEDYLVKFDFAPQRDRAVATRYFNVSGVAFDMRPWRTDAHTTPHTFWYHTKLSIEGLPLHAWKDSDLVPLTIQCTFLDVSAGYTLDIHGVPTTRRRVPPVGPQAELIVHLDEHND